MEKSLVGRTHVCALPRADTPIRPYTRTRLGFLKGARLEILALLLPERLDFYDPLGYIL